MRVNEGSEMWFWSMHACMLFACCHYVVGLGSDVAVVCKHERIGFHVVTPGNGNGGWAAAAVGLVGGMEWNRGSGGIGWVAWKDRGCGVVVWIDRGCGWIDLAMINIFGVGGKPGLTGWLG